MNDEEIDLLLNGKEEEVIVKPEDICAVFPNKDKEPQETSTEKEVVYIKNAEGKTVKEVIKHKNFDLSQLQNNKPIEAKAVDFNGKSGPIQKK